MKLLTPLFLLALSISIFVWFINPRYQGLGDIKGEIVEREAGLQRAVNVGIKRDELIAKYRSMNQADLQRLEKFLPSSVDTVRLSLDISTLTEKFGSKAKGLSVQAGKASPETLGPSEDVYGVVDVSFGVTMPYERFLQFMNELEKNLRLTDFGIVNFTAQDKGTYDYTVNLKLYWLK